MNFLTLCQMTRREAGISGTGPGAVTGQTGQLEKVVEWVKQSWSELQLDRGDWNFRWKQFTLNTVSGTRDYAPDDYSITDLELWDTNSFKIYLQSAGVSEEANVAYLPYGGFRAKYGAGLTARPNDRPNEFTILPDGKIRLEPAPNGIYVLSGDYKRTEDVLAANADVPDFPSKFHAMLAWKAVIKYGLTYSAPEIIAKGEYAYDDYYDKLMLEELPEMQIGRNPLTINGDSAYSSYGFDFS